MKIIADAGSTKIEWAIADDYTRPSDAKIFVTSGYNAAISSPSALTALIKEEAPGLIKEGKDADSIIYYGAGCIGDRAKLTSEALSATFGCGNCRVESDMLGAARALCGDFPGIACILGTGSNSCRYDGRNITDNIPPLGFILGDEGSGAVLGKLFIGKLFKGALGEKCYNRFKAAFPDIDAATVIRRVYRSEQPNSFLAGFSPFILNSLDIPEVAKMVEEEFINFFRLDVIPYEGSSTLPVHFVGSIAYHFSGQLRNAASQCGINIGKIIKKPLEALLEYHRED